jgi:hypothetical protein
MADKEIKPMLTGVEQIEVLMKWEYCKKRAGELGVVVELFTSDSITLRVDSKFIYAYDLDQVVLVLDSFEQGRRRGYDEGHKIAEAQAEVRNKSLIERILLLEGALDTDVVPEPDYSSPLLPSVHDLKSAAQEEVL